MAHLGGLYQHQGNDETEEDNYLFHDVRLHASGVGFRRIKARAARPDRQSIAQIEVFPASIVLTLRDAF